MRWRIGNCVFDKTARQVSGPVETHLNYRQGRLLEFLIVNYGQPYKDKEMIRAVWEGQSAEGSLHKYIAVLRDALGGERKSHIDTDPYRLIVEPKLLEDDELPNNRGTLFNVPDAAKRDQPKGPATNLSPKLDTNPNRMGSEYAFLSEKQLSSEDIDDDQFPRAASLLEPAKDLDVELRERTYFNYRDETVAALNTSDTSWALASRYERKPLTIGDQAFPVTILWQNRKSLIPPDDILGTLDYSKPEYLSSSPTLSVTDYALARKLIKLIYTAGPVKHEGLEYCMTSINLNGSLPRIEGRFGRYYDNILTQYAMEWELKKALKEHGQLALERNRVGMLPLREAVEFGTNQNPLLDGGMRCTAITVSMLTVFERREQGLWTIIHQRSKEVGLSAGMLHVVPAGMFEAKNKGERWSIRTAVMREMLEEVYNEEEQQSEEIAGFEDDMVSKKPLQFLLPLIENGHAELSLTGICCDLLNLRPEICTVLFVPDAGLAEVQKMHVNWEYEQHGDPGNFGTPWDRIDAKLQNAKVGEIVPSGVACLKLGRTWMRERHGV